MQMTLNTPALLFPTVSLLLLAYTNRFMALARLIRSLHARYAENHDERTRAQIDSLRRRVVLIKNMQFTGILSILLCVVCMFALYTGYEQLGVILFGASLALLALSLVLTLVEIQTSVSALSVELQDMEDRCTSHCAEVERAEG